MKNKIVSIKIAFLASLFSCMLQATPPKLIAPHATVPALVADIRPASLQKNEKRLIRTKRWQTISSSDIDAMTPERVKTFSTYLLYKTIVGNGRFDEQEHRKNVSTLLTYFIQKGDEVALTEVFTKVLECCVEKEKRLYGRHTAFGCVFQAEYGGKNILEQVCSSCSDEVVLLALQIVMCFGSQTRWMLVRNHSTSPALKQCGLRVHNSGLFEAIIARCNPALIKQFESLLVTFRSCEETGAGCVIKSLKKSQKAFTAQKKAYEKNYISQFSIPELKKYVIVPVNRTSEQQCLAPFGSENFGTAEKQYLSAIEPVVHLVPKNPFKE